MRTLPPLAVAAVLLASGALAAPPAPPALPAPVDLVSARAFTLKEALPIPGRPDLERSGRGLLLVLAAQPALVWPRQSAQPVLYAGETLAARVNHGWPAGRLVVVVLGTSEMSGLPIWFGRTGLPEQVDPATIAAEREFADANGITAFPPRVIERALAAGGEPLSLDDASELQPYLAALLDEHDPNRPGARR